jgi:Uma2 family endonuclease
MSMFSTTKMTARQFSLLGEDPPGVHLELVEGEIAVSPSPQPLHSRVDKRLSRILLNYIVDNDLGDLLGDTDTVLDEFNVRRPDLLYFTKAQIALINMKKPIRTMPELCVEIISLSSDTVDRRDKFRQYATARIAHYWIINPDERTIEAFILDGSEYQSAGQGRDQDIVRFAPFPDLAIHLDELWPPTHT